MPKVSIGDAEIYYEETGAGPPLLLVPGLNGNGSFWAKQVPALARHFRVIVHDHRGCGQSTFSKIKYSVEQMASDTVKLMDALAIDRAHFLGHSTGGAMGQVIATDHPGRIRGLVLSATWPGSDAFFRRAFETRRAVLEKLGVGPYARASANFLWPAWWIATHDAELDQMERQAVANPQPVEITLSRIDAICAFDRRARLKDIAAPTLVIVAADDIVTPPHLAEELVYGIGGARLKILDKGGHFAPIVDPEAYNSAVLAFLRVQG